MATTTVRKFAISIDPDEAVDFAEGVDWFAQRLAQLGFEQSGTYTFRYRDAECMMKVELKDSQDGYFVYLYVQADDEHVFRASEVAKAFDAHIVDTAGTKRHSLRDKDDL
jgi:Na+-transporting NADH:ubiquinone oxidoreductase subunit NqrF